VIHPDSTIAAIDDAIGIGVRAIRPIPRGTLLWVLDRFDVVVSPGEFRQLTPLHQRLLRHYGYRDHAARWILCWDGGRLVNHSCEPAMRGVGPEVMIAVRDLAPGDELTCDYAECNTDPPMTCLCGSPTCRGSVSGVDLLAHHARWDQEVSVAIGDAGAVDQPLQSVVLDPAGLQAILDGRRAAPSLRDVYLDPEVRLRADRA